MSHDVPLLINGDRVSARGADAAFQRVTATIMSGRGVAYPARLDGRRVVIVGFPREDGIVPVAVMVDDALAANLDISEATSREGLMVDDRRVN